MPSVLRGSKGPFLDRANLQGWKAGWQFYPFSGKQIKDIVHPDVLRECGIEICAVEEE